MMTDVEEFDECCSYDGDGFDKPQLDLGVQKAQVAADHWRDHSVWCDRHNEASQLSIQNRRIALKILVSEACRRDMEYAQRQGLDTSQVAREWRQIASDAMGEMEMGDNSMSVLRKLSSMSVFIEGNVCRQYGENVEGRTRRLETQHSLINRLRRGKALFCTPPTSPGIACAQEEKPQWASSPLLADNKQRDIRS